MRRSALAALAAASLFVAAAVGVIAVRVQQVHLAYRIDMLRAARTGADSVRRQLEVELATLRSPQRVDTQARQLGMAPAGHTQVHVAREFVAGPSGLAGARAARIEASAR